MMKIVIIVVAKVANQDQLCGGRAYVLRKGNKLVPSLSRGRT